MLDLVLTNARIIDGLGAPAREGSLGVQGGRIAALSTDRRGGDLGPARETVDAGGRVLAPGIVDIHTHYDAQLTWDPFATPSAALGVTTVVIGNCGFTIAPCRPAAPRPHRAQPHPRGGDVAGGPPRGHQLGFRDVPRLSRRRWSGGAAC